MIISRKHTMHLIANSIQVLVRKTFALNMGNLCIGKFCRDEFTIQPHEPHQQMSQVTSSEARRTEWRSLPISDNCTANQNLRSGKN